MINVVAKETVISQRKGDFYMLEKRVLFDISEFCNIKKLEQMELFDVWEYRYSWMLEQIGLMHVGEK